MRISTQRDGSVYLECLSHQSVYVRSYYLDFEHNSEYGMTVHKFCSGAPNRKVTLKLKMFWIQIVLIIRFLLRLLRSFYKLSLIHVF